MNILTENLIRQIMPEAITATYRNGCLHPLIPLNIPDNEAVHLIILPAEISDESDDIRRMMLNAGLIRSFRPSADSVPPDPVSEKKRSEIAGKLGRSQGKTLSEIIIAERDQ